MLPKDPEEAKQKYGCRKPGGRVRRIHRGKLERVMTEFAGLGARPLQPELDALLVDISYRSRALARVQQGPDLHASAADPTLEVVVFHLTNQLPFFNVFLYIFDRSFDHWSKVKKDY